MINTKSKSVILSNFRLERYVIPSLLILIFSICLSVFPFNYDYYQSHMVVTYFGLIIGVDKEATILQNLHLFVAVAWFFLMFYLFLFLFYPLGKSFSLSNQLWLRLTNCKPYDIAVSRVIRVVSHASLWGLLACLWAIGTVNLINAHLVSQVSLGELLWEAAAISSYIICTGGIITFFLTFINLFNAIIDPLISILFSVFAWVSFIFFMLIYGVVYFGYPGSKWIEYLPLSAPMLFIKDFNDYGKHLAITMFLGTLLLGLSIVITQLDPYNKA